MVKNLESNVFKCYFNGKTIDLDTFSINDKTSVSG